jgi:hypothetical protein
MDLLKNKKVIIALAVFLLLVITAITVNRKNDADKPATQIDKGQTYDPDSDSTISDPPGKDNDNYGTNTDAPNIAGTSVLIDDGISLEQEDSLKFALYSHFGGQSKGTTRIAVISDSIVPVPYDPNSTSGFGTINFRIKVNLKDTYKVTLNYYDDLESVQTIIYSTTDQQLYDSGVISGKSLQDKID